MQSVIPLKDLVLIGGGHAHVHTIKMFGMKPQPGVRVTLITRDIETPYSGMLPGYVAGYYTRDECHIDLGRLCSFAGVRLLHVEACGLDTTEKLVFCKDGRPPVRYDVLSIDIGITPAPLPRIFESGCLASESITPVKPIDGFARRFELILARVLGTSSLTPLRIVVVGGGGGGVELCFALYQRFKSELVRVGKDASLVKIMLLNRGNTLLSSHKPAVQQIVSRLLQKKQIEVLLNANIIDVEQQQQRGFLVSEDTRRFEFDEAVWCTQASAQGWIRETNLEISSEGFICVQPTLESVNVRDVFACGDVAHLVDNPRPKAGVFAVRAGPPLTANLRRRLLNEPLELWVPQSEFLGIIGTGDGYALASKGAMGIEGAYLWKLKDRIDRVWMSGYQDLPDREEMMREMAKKKKEEARREGGGSGGDEEEEQALLAQSMGQDVIDMLSKAKMRCGGCGSKVGAQVLSRALKRVRDLLPDRPEVIAGIGKKTGDDAALVLPPAPPAYLVHTIDYFRSFVGDPYLFGQIAANHSLSDVHAMNAEAVSALALCVLPFGPEDKVEDTLVHMLAGCLNVLRKENCALVGGHTSEGAEPALGVAVNGVVHPDRVFHKGPLPLGNVLVLTKGLGTGTIMAADMRAKARGGWVANAFASMVQSNAPAAKILAKFGCTACTDVTGFGFLGHLIEMIQYGEDGEKTREGSGGGGGGGGGGDEATEGAALAKTTLTAVSISLDSVPLLLGAAACIEAGIVSTLQPQNIRCARAVANVEFGKGKPSYPLLFDPQTSGGLLASVPLEQAEGLVEALREAGYAAAAVVGKVIERQEGEFASLVVLE